MVLQLWACLAEGVVCCFREEVLTPVYLEVLELLEILHCHHLVAQTVVEVGGDLNEQKKERIFLTW